MSRQTLGLTAIDAFGAATIVGLTAGVWCFGILPVLRNHQAERTMDQRLGALEDELADVADEAERAEARVREAGAMLAAIDARPGPASGVNERIATMLAIAHEAAVEVTQIQPGETSVHESWIAVPIRLSGEGEPAGLVTFLARLREQAPDIAVDHLAFSVGRGGSAQAMSVEIGATWRGLATAP